jgi:hypothetical protein
MNRYCDAIKNLGLGHDDASNARTESSRAVGSICPRARGRGGAAREIGRGERRNREKGAYGI